MATDRGDDGEIDGCSIGGDGRDHISSLPDHLLHSILLRLPGGTAADAARTSVLSRRWRRVWAHLPDLLFYYRGDESDDDGDAPPTLAASQCGARRPAASRVGAALAAHTAPSVRCLDISLPCDSSRHLTEGHVSSWLRFASRHVAGELRLAVPPFCNVNNEGEVEDVILLPICERVTSIGFNLGGNTLGFRPPAAGTRELEDMLSCRCPSLKKLELEWVSIALQDGATAVLSLCSGSLEWLQIVAIQFDGRLQVAAPKLRTFHGRIIPCEFYMAAPMLAEFCWHDNNCDYNGYHPTRHLLAVAAGHRLRRLEIDASSSGLELMRRFKTVHELDLTVHVTQDIQEYARFLEDTNILASCEVLVVRFTKMEHTFTSAMLHLLKQCARVRKLVVQLSSNMEGRRQCMIHGFFVIKFEVYINNNKYEKYNMNLDDISTEY
ncbi:unnamed protein product [Urochloa decumbens]|uniref:F-box domain-containing protein n=1 Tax=Urochloa decumbens TaxID=240449 RepID=A0ABC9G4B8_9POAL